MVGNHFGWVLVEVFIIGIQNNLRMCLTPINLRKETAKQLLNDTYHYQQVPCGRCLDCRANRVNSWFVRLNSELSCSSSAYFCTLTYGETEIPYSSNGYPTLHVPDFQRFIKRLRKCETGSRAIKYFAVGEYGTQTHRPHYHAIIFNVTDPELINKAWGLGHVHVGSVKDESIFTRSNMPLKPL